MEIHFVVLSYLSFFILNDVYGIDADERKSVMEGDSVTLHTDVIKQTDDLIVWYYGPENTVIAKINGKADSNMSSDDGRFRDRLKLDDQTGDLIITNITTQHTGDYTLKISRNNKATYKKINVNVYAGLPIPVISRSSSQCSSSSLNCSLLCSVLNVSDVSLSWYKGNSLLSIISVSDLNIRLSLPLEVEYQDTNTYSCVLNNTITNQTQQLNINHLCQTCSDSPVLRVFIIPAVIVILLFVICMIISCVLKKNASRMKHLIDEEKSNTSSMVEDPEASRFLNGV